MPADEPQHAQIVTVAYAHIPPRAGVPDASVSADSRDHNITGYPTWLAGAGVKSGFTDGATDDYSLKAGDGRMHTTDLHATLLALMGLDHS